MDSQHATIAKLVGELSRSHLTCAPANEATLKKGLSIGLPHDLIEFYRLTNGAYIHETDRYGGSKFVENRWWKWMVVPIDDLLSIADIFKVDTHNSLFHKCEEWIAVVDVMDWNSLAVDVAQDRRGQIIDCFHETIGDEGYHAIVALSFVDALERLMTSVHPYWLEESFTEFGSY